MGAYLKHYPEFGFSVGLFSGAVSSDETLEVLNNLDKSVNYLILFVGEVDLTRVDVAQLPAMKRAVTPTESEFERHGPKLSAFINLSNKNDFFVRFWVHYTSVGVSRTRKRAIFSTIEAACTWLGSPLGASEQIAALVRDVVNAGEGEGIVQQKTAENRNKIINAASRLFRTRGFDGVSEAKIMEEAGLGADSFDEYFPSRDNLIVYALLSALEDFGEPDLRLYLSPAHKIDLEGGCPVAALASEAVHQSPAARAAMTVGLNARIEDLSREAPGADADSRRKAAVGSLAAMVGALILARVSDDEDLAQELLSVTETWIEEQGRTTDVPPERAASARDSS